MAEYYNISCPAIWANFKGINYLKLLATQDRIQGP